MFEHDSLIHDLRRKIIDKDKTWEWVGLSEDVRAKPVYGRLGHFSPHTGQYGPF